MKEHSRNHMATPGNKNYQENYERIFNKKTHDKKGTTASDSTDESTDS